MTSPWKIALSSDPIPTLQGAGDPALEYFVRRDLMDEPVAPIEFLWDILQARRLVGKQRPEGNCLYSGKTYDPITNANYNLLETYRSLNILVECYGFQRTHPVVKKAAEYVFSCQTDEGDIRGILGTQYMPYYHAALLEMLVKAGYQEDHRTIKGLEWLLSMRQEDGGWIIPAQLVPAVQMTGQFWHSSPLTPDRSAPHSHLATGMVLRVFAAHPAYRNEPAVIKAANCFRERFFKPDKYSDRREPGYWLKFQFPFWWTNLLTALDSLFWLGFTRNDESITEVWHGSVKTSHRMVYGRQATLLARKPATPAYGLGWRFAEF